MSRVTRLVTSRKGLTFLALVSMLVLGILIGPIVSDQVLSFQEARSSSQLKISSEAAPLVAAGPSKLAEGFRGVSESFRPYVVNISTRSVPRRARRDSNQPDEGLDLFERFFGRQAQPQQVRSLGSGTIVDEKGYIITNHHVIAPQTDRRGTRRVADRIEVLLSSGDRHTAQVVGSDQDSDIAVLKIDADKPLEAASIGDTTEMQIGDWVLAIGSPFGLEQTVTAGIVSAKARQGDRFGGGANLFGDYLQTDAAINPGNSGGPLVNMSGQLVGINSFITTQSGGSQGIGFAIPSNVFVNAYNQLVEKGRIERGWIGVSMNLYPMTSEMAEYFGVAGEDPDGIKDGDGVLITELIGEDSRPSKDSPAARAGLRAEDVVVKIGDRLISSTFDLRSAVATSAPGETLKVTAVRKGEILNFDVTLEKRQVEERQRRETRRMSFDEEEEKDRPKEIGIAFEDLTDAEAEQLGVQGDRGRVVITEVTVASLADEAGLRRGHVVEQVNGVAVTSAASFFDAVSELSRGDAAILRVIVPNPRGSNTIYFTSFLKP